MRFIKFLFTLTTAVASFAALVYLFQRVQNPFDQNRSDSLNDDDLSGSSVHDSPASTTDLHGVYYKSMDPEEISESD